jgi:hypothetical protein
MNSRSPRVLNSAARVLGGTGFCALIFVRAAFGQDDLMDRIDEQLTFSGWNDAVRVRVSGTLDLEGYADSQPPPGLLYSEDNLFFVPRLSLFLDAQLGPYLYGFVQLRADNGFDPGEGGQTIRPDEYVIRFTPWDDGRFNLQVGKFATVVGSWAPRHGSWDNPFITAPLPYENLTGIWDTTAARFTEELQAWAGVLPKPSPGGALLDHYRNVPIIWGPSYASGASIFGDIGKFDYAFEMKNTSLSGRPETWSPTQTQWQEPTFSGRLGYRPNEMWNLGVSASVGPYLQPEAEATLPPGRNIDQYREMVLGQDIGFAWHHVQLWAEAYEARFTLPGVGNADTLAYYIEAKYKFTPQFFAALRWNQQLFSGLTNAAGQTEGWSRNVWRVDMGPGYRFTAHTQVKLQYSIEYQQADLRNWDALLALQFTTRF